MKRGSRDLWALMFVVLVLLVLLVLLLLLLLLLFMFFMFFMSWTTRLAVGWTDGFGMKLAVLVLVLLLLMGSEPETTMRRRETGLVLGMAAGACFDGREWVRVVSLLGL